jgi:membrane protein DedA with SNARE-associated domain
VCSGSSLDSWSPKSLIGSSVYERNDRAPIHHHRTLLNPVSIVDAIGYPAAGLGIFIESAGVPFPGEALLLAAAAWAAARHYSLVIVILCGFVGSVAGADLGYYLGHRGGRPFVERFGSIFHIRPEHIAHAEMFFARHGDKAILGARFILGLRTWGSMLAGMARMPFWRFQVFSALGGLAWSVLIGVAGYLLGSNLSLITAVIKGIGIGGLVLVVVIAAVALLARWRAARP